MEKVCIFCGKKPIDKTNEHVIPRWLIELTGNPNRLARFGYGLLGNGKLEERIYYFDSFQFPACNDCNKNFSTLESETKNIIEKLLMDDFLTWQEIGTLLDWLDKVRIGLWLGYLYLDKNPHKIKPHYYIEQRIGIHDRVLDIIKTDDKTKGIHWVGCDTPSFSHIPSCFILRINNYYFFNISFNNLLARRIGFPYPKESYWDENDRTVIKMAYGRNRVMRPVLKKRINLKCTEIYQPIFTGNNVSEKLKKSLYDTKYVRENSISWDMGVGKIFINGNEQLTEYPNSPSKLWIPSEEYHLRDILFELQILPLEWQLYLNDLLPSLKLLTPEQRTYHYRVVNSNNNYNKLLIDILRKRYRKIKKYRTDIEFLKRLFPKILLKTLYLKDIDSHSESNIPMFV
jgi:hypothetical protein